MAKRKGNKNASTVSASGGPVDGAMARALSHPTRCEILAFLAEQEIASPVEMFREGIGKNKTLGKAQKLKIAHVSYHVHVLEELGLLVLVKERAVRGATEHFYRATTRMLLTLEEWTKLPKGSKKDVSIAAVEEAVSLAQKAFTADTFDTFNERAVINITLRLAPAAFIQLTEEMTDFALKRCEELQRESIAEVEGDLSKLPYFSTSMLAYESPPPKRKKRKKT
jgi:DNA-binding transcriptional ArsR family regulator